MSRLIKGIFGVAAVVATLGAVQLAFGHDLGLQGFSATPVDVVNRAAKADREMAVAAPSLRTRTVSVRLISLPDTSVLIRMPLQQRARSTAPAPTLLRSSAHKPNAACEPVVSVLTEIAKRLQPGRCLT
jgi:hypothetical protein